MEKIRHFPAWVAERCRAFRKWLGDYMWSVQFFKHLIIAGMALVVLIPVTLAVRFGVCYHLSQVSLRAARTETQQAQEDAQLAREQAAEAEAAMLSVLAAQPQPRTILPEREKPAGERTAAEILEQEQIVAHALGATDEVMGLNCLEGFLQNYEKGVRVFEADLRLTSDGYVVLRHDWRANWQDDVSETALPTLAEYLARPILEQYTPLSFRELLYLMVEYPDVCIITDTKYVEAEAVTEQFSAMVEEAHAMGLTYLFDRFIVQVYSELMFHVTDNVHHFPYYIYTLYNEGFARTSSAFRRKADFCRENDILGITMWNFWWDDSYAGIADWRGVKVFVHTVNDASEARSLLKRGVDGVYSDLLVPEDLEET